MGRGGSESKEIVTIDRVGKVSVGTHVPQDCEEFILKDDLQSEFAINKLNAITKSCLTYLTREEVKMF